MTAPPWEGERHRSLTLRVAMGCGSQSSVFSCRLPVHLAGQEAAGAADLVTAGVESAGADLSIPEGFLAADGRAGLGLEAGPLSAISRGALQVVEQLADLADQGL